MFIMSIEKDGLRMKDKIEKNIKVDSKKKS
jgi:hypothetical protein